MEEENVKVMTDKYLEWFAGEFCKHNELMKPARTYRAQSRGQRRALLRLGAALGCGELKAALREVRAFKQQCVNKMRLLVRQAPHAGSGVLVLAPAWLQKLDRPFGLVSTALQLEELAEGPAPGGRRAAQFRWELYWSVRAAVLSEPARLLRDAGDAFADRKRLPRGTVQAVWRRMYEAALARLRAGSRRGDLPWGERPGRLDWRIVDLALMYAPDVNLVLPESFSNPPELEALLQLYKLMSEALRRPEEDGLRRQGSAGAAPTGGSDGPTNRTADNNRDAEPCRCGAGSQPAAEPEWDSAETWLQVHADYYRSGRAASLVALQRRWLELRAQARRDVLRAARGGPAPHPLLLAIGKRFPRAVTAPPPAWPQLVADKRIHVDEFGAQVTPEPAQMSEPNPSLMNDLVADLLDCSDDEPEIIETGKSACVQIDSDAEGDADVSNPARTDTPSKGFIRESDDSSTVLVVLSSDSIQGGNTPAHRTAEENQTTAVVKSEPFDEASHATASEPLEQKVSVNALRPLLPADIAVKDDPDSELHYDRPKKPRIMFEDEDDLDEIDKFEANLEYLRLSVGDVNTSCKSELTEIDTGIKVEQEEDAAGEDQSHHRGAGVKSEPAADDSEVNGSCDASGPEARPAAARTARNGYIDEKLLMLARVVLEPLPAAPVARPPYAADPLQPAPTTPAQGGDSTRLEHIVKQLSPEQPQPAPAAPRPGGVAGEPRALSDALPRGYKALSDSAAATDSTLDDADAPAALAEPLSEAALKQLIRTLTVPSIHALRAANVARREQHDRDGYMLQQRERETARARSCEYKQLDSEILQIVRSLENEGIQKPEPKIVKKPLVLGEDEKPLPDAYQEWQRQKTLVHKYFNFYRPDTCNIPKDGKNKRKEIKAGNKTAARHRHTKETYQNTIDLMNVSDNEETTGAGDDSMGHKKNKNQPVKDAKRSSSGEAAENLKKRVKLTESSAKTDKDGKHAHSDDNKMMIDERVEDGCCEDDPITLTDPLATEVSNAPPTQPPAWPLNAAPGLKTNHDRSQKVIYVIQNFNNVWNSPCVMNAAPVATAGHASALDVAIASTINTLKLPQDVSLTPNTSLTPPNTKWPTFYFIQADGKTVEKQSAVLEVHPKHPLLSKTAPTPLSESGAGPEPSSLISEAASQEGFVNDAPPSTTVEEIDLTDDVEDDTAGEEGRPIVNMASLKHIKIEMEDNSTAEIVPAANGEAEELHSTSNATDDRKHLTIQETKNIELQSDYENRTFSLETGPVQTYSDINEFTDTALTKTINHRDRSFATKRTNNTNDVIETICLDSEDSDEVETSRVVRVREACQTGGSEGETDAADVAAPTTFRGKTADRVPHVATDVIVPKVEKNLAKLTPITTSKDLLNLSSEELAVFDADGGKIETPKNTTAQGFQPIKIKKEKRWGEEIQLSKDGREVEGERSVGTKGATIKQEAAVPTDDAGSEEASADSKEFVLRGVLPTAPPDATSGESPLR